MRRTRSVDLLKYLDNKPSTTTSPTAEVEEVPQTEAIPSATPPPKKQDAVIFDAGLAPRPAWRAKSKT
jgi:hypothetical protein